MRHRTSRDSDDLGSPGGPAPSLAGLSRLPAAYRRIAALIALVAAYVAFANLRPDFTDYNADDAESYLALSYALVHGLGYTRSLLPGAYVPHTTWPPGMPLLLAPAMALSGATVN